VVGVINGLNGGTVWRLVIGKRLETDSNRSISKLDLLNFIQPQQL